ncbi:hypothetical protein [Natranaerofaba carboxydovora]|uniref:hypothetical protein n=1 Tax=Natranaerofaba carboxydovora TaxID=2742683 RepID=UPI001F14349B|nr:hypothetical protein [Natranaerofaba carboxydovora]UMZ73936.1 hypothetical protein ACONDI_01506 [Natranaerofaba carboxydovora]
MLYLTSIGISVISTKLLLKVMKVILTKNNFMLNNYKNKKIPTALGIVFPLSYIAVILPLLFYINTPIYIISLTYLCWGFSFLGLLDDFFGRDTSKGFGGHLKAFLFKKIITTGLLKAFFGLILSFKIAAVLYVVNSTSIYQLFINGFVIALSANAMNSLDLRPGRAGKIFLILGGLSIYYTQNWQALHLIPLIISVLIYLPGDLKAEYMLGDTGANTLGAFLGGYAVFFFSFEIHIFLLIGLIFFHILTEIVSLSKLIEKTPIISHIDNWGRS